MTVQFASSTIFRVAALPNGSNKVPATHTLTIASAAESGDDELSVSTTTGYLQAGAKLTVGGVDIVVRADTPRGSTTIPVVPLTAPIVNAATGSYLELLEFIGGSTINLTGNDNVINIRNFKSNQWADNAKVMTGVSFECDGQFHKEDKALTAVIRPAFFTLGQEVYAELRRENGDIWRGNFLVSNYSEPTTLDNVVQVRFTLASQGAVQIPTPGSLTVV